MEEQITDRLSYLCQNITNLTEILIYLIEHRILSTNESDEIKAEKTPLSQNLKLLNTLGKKDWNLIGNLFLEILRKTNNKHCADRIEGISTSSQARNHLLHHKISKWWPDYKPLIKCLHKRKIGPRLLVEELHDRILADENRTVVLCESEHAAKLTGMGGVGKTLTAKWYAHHYEEEYDHILWIDCGEDSLKKSFQSLALDLEIKNWEKYNEVEEFARKSFQVLCQFKCLCIYDNAESYQGQEGIFKVLPKAKENFFCLITSRSRDWGVENVGYGNISALELDIFNEQESMQFMKANLDGGINRTDHELKELCRLMGNLPLALQLAVAALNTRKIDLNNYIEKTSAKDAGEIVAKKFDDYEKTINKNIKISLQLIRNKEKNGEVAFDILMAFGYIRPDNVTSKLFLTIFNSKLNVLKGAVDVLEKYSLVSRTGLISEVLYDNYILNKFFGRDKIEVEMDMLSIHRLLQQVLRHNGKDKEKQTLQKILGCQGFIDYKFIPFTKYANENLQKQFPKVKAELLDQQQLLKLIVEQRFDEAVDLAKFMNQELKTKTTKLNYAICLLRTGQTVDDIIHAVEKLFTRRKESNKLTGFVEEVFKYCHKMKVESECYYPKICMTEEPTELAVGSVLLYCYLRLGNYQQALTISKQIVTDVDALIPLLVLTRIPNYELKVIRKEVQLKLDVETKKIELYSCCLWLDSFDRLSPEELTLYQVKFFGDGEELKEVKINDFIHLPTIKRLTLSCDYNNLIVDLSGDVSIDYLHLHNVQVLNWTNSNWSIKELQLINIALFEKTNMEVQEMRIWDSTLDVSCLPQTIHKITLINMKVFMSGEVKLPHLEHLELINMMDIDCLWDFPSVPLTHINLWDIKDVIVDFLPPTVTKLKISKPYYSGIFIVGGVSRVDNLILKSLTFKEVQQCLRHFHTDNLTIRYNHYIGVNSLMLLMKKPIKTIALGKIRWGEEQFNNYSNHLDRQAEFYLLEGGRGTAMEEEDFKKRLEW